MSSRVYLDVEVKVQAVMGVHGAVRLHVGVHVDVEVMVHAAVGFRSAVEVQVMVQVMV